MVPSIFLLYCWLRIFFLFLTVYNFFLLFFFYYYYYYLYYDIISPQSPVHQLPIPVVRSALSTPGYWFVLIHPSFIHQFIIPLFIHPFIRHSFIHPFFHLSFLYHSIRNSFISLSKVSSLYLNTIHIHSFVQRSIHPSILHSSTHQSPIHSYSHPPHFNHPSLPSTPLTDYHVPSEYHTNIYVRDKLAPLRLSRCLSACD